MQCSTSQLFTLICKMYKNYNPFWQYLKIWDSLGFLNATPTRYMEQFYWIAVDFSDVPNKVVHDVYSSPFVPAAFSCYPPSCPVVQRTHTSIANPQVQPLPSLAAASLPFDEGWWRCMSGGIDNIYGCEWEWSIFLSGPVTPLAKLHHGQLPRQTPSSLLPLLPGPHLHMDTWTH